MKRLFLLVSFIVSSYMSFSQPASATWSVKFANAMVSRYQPTINAMTNKGWEYSNSIILHGMEKVYNQVLDASYLNYIKTYVDTYVNSSGTISQSMVSLDKAHPGISCLFLWEQTGQAKYKTAATNIRNAFVGPGASYNSYKTAQGIFWHKQSGYNNMVLIDGIYMLHPFLAKYGRLFNDNAAIDTAVNQTLFIYNQLYDNTTHLIKHAWTSTPSAYSSTWAPDANGRSSEVWSRGMGWFVMALVDELKYVPASHPKRAQLLSALSNLSVGIQTFQDASTGLWYQVVDKGGQPGNYLETSGSAMFVYAIKTAVDSGWINSSYLTVAQNGWAGLQTKISAYPTDGLPAINDFAPAMSVQKDYNAYVGITSVDAPSPIGGPPSGTQSPHGFAAIMMAASVMEFPLTALPVKFTNVTANWQGKNVLLKWENTDYSEVTKYIVERSENGNNFAPIARLAPQEVNNQWLDLTPNSDILYYRIKSVSTNNATVYSKSVSVTKKMSAKQLSISPNPVNNGLMKIFVYGLKAGNYQFIVSDVAGESLINTPVAITENTEEEIQLPPSAKGIFYVQIKGNQTNLKRSILVH